MLPTYEDQGLVAWAIADQEHDGGDAARFFAEQLGIDLPILLDRGGLVHALYPIEQAFPSAAYPQQWLVGTDGRIAYVANELDHDALTAAIERELNGE
ncbi:MAG: redoxin domain-containing protein [Myxococcales bacterium]|nr:redoxin domain-containing protein [Myxococcales bacterium]